MLERLLLACDLKSVVISAYGLREGILYARLPPEERSLDTLLEYAEGSNARQARSPAHAHEMFDWLNPLFGDETAGIATPRASLTAAMIACGSLGLARIRLTPTRSAIARASRTR